MQIEKINKIVSETAPHNANKKHVFQFRAIFSLFLQFCLRDYFVLPLCWHSLTLVLVSPPVNMAQTQTKMARDSTYGGFCCLEARAGEGWRAKVRAQEGNETRSLVIVQQRREDQCKKQLFLERAGKEIE